MSISYIKMPIFYKKNTIPYENLCKKWHINFFMKKQTNATWAAVSRVFNLADVCVWLFLVFLALFSGFFGVFRCFGGGFGILWAFYALNNLNKLFFMDFAILFSLFLIKFVFFGEKFALKNQSYF
jgi:hypothetical protein